LLRKNWGKIEKEKGKKRAYQFDGDDEDGGDAVLKREKRDQTK